MINKIKDLNEKRMNKFIMLTFEKISAKAGDRYELVQIFSKVNN